MRRTPPTTRVDDDDRDDGDDGDGLLLDDLLLAHLDDDDSLDPFAVAFAAIDVDVLRVAEAMLEQGALDPQRSAAADRRHRVSRHPATRRPGRR